MCLFMKQKELGVIAPDTIDIRDFQIAEIQKQGIELPEEYDLRQKMTPIGLQNWGSCTSWAGCAIKEYWDKKEYGRDINLSEKFNYYNIKKISGLWQTEGDYLRNSIKALCQYGAPLLEDYPDEREGSWKEYISPPPQELYEKAKKYKGKTYWSVVNTLDSFRRTMFSFKCPIATGMKWYKSYYKEGNDGKLPLPDGDCVGGHAIACVGWTKDKLWFKNSWGTHYGKEGYFYIPFDEFTKHDFWNAWAILDEDVPKPEMTEGWVADSWLKSEFTKGEIAWTTYKLNFRTSPWGNVIKTLGKGDKVKILGETKKDSRGLTWQKISLIK